MSSGFREIPVISTLVKPFSSDSSTLLGFFLTKSVILSESMILLTQAVGLLAVPWLYSMALCYNMLILRSENTNKPAFVRGICSCRSGEGGN